MKTKGVTASDTFQKEIIERFTEKRSINREPKIKVVKTPLPRTDHPESSAKECIPPNFGDGRFGGG